MHFKMLYLVSRTNKTAALKNYFCFKVTDWIAQ